MKRRTPNDPTTTPRLTRQGTLEPDLHPDDFEPHLPTRTLRERGGIIGHLKSSLRSTTPKAHTPTSRRRPGVKGRTHSAKVFPQRVVVKARVVGGRGASSLERMRKHRSYLARSGAGLTGRAPEFFDRGGTCSQEQLHRQGGSWVNDSHHFRLIISPEHAAQLELQDYVRAVMQQVERDLKTGLQWYGVCHHNTDNPHAHVVLRGVDEDGKSLVISREYMGHGLRHVAEREASVRLGLRSSEELERGLARMLSEERFTWIDKGLLQELNRSGHGVVRVLPLRPDATEVARRARLTKLKRLAFLETKGLCREERTGVWRVEGDLEPVLRELGQRRSIERLVAPFLAGREEAKQDLVIHKESQHFAPQELSGIVLAKDLIDELHDKRFLLLSGSDGRNHFIPLGPFSEPSGFECRVGQVVRVVGQRPTGVRAEEVIERYLGGKQGEFYLERFTKHVKQQVTKGAWTLPTGLSVSEYMERFRARVESLHRAGVIESLGDGSGGWRIPGDVVERAKSFDAVAQKRLKVSVVPQSYRPLKEEISIRGASWLDYVVAKAPDLIKAAGAFGLEVSRALKERGKVLQERGIAQTTNTYRELLSKDERLLRADLQRRFGKPCRHIQGAREIFGELLRYELLGDGHRMVVLTEEGFLVLHRVSKQEARLRPGSAVTLSLVRDREGGSMARRLLVRALSKEELSANRDSRARRGRG